MPSIDPSQNPLRDLWSRATSSLGSAPAVATSTPSGSPAVRSKADADVHYDNVVEHLPDPPTVLPVLTARLDPVGPKLDAIHATMKGPYLVAGKTVESGAQFRMNGGYNQGQVNAGTKDGQILAGVAAKVGLLNELSSLQAGRGRPESLVKLTQALIDAGQLQDGNAGPLADRIHDLQWRFGLGMDCAGYVYRAVTAMHGDPSKLGLKPCGFENFTGLGSNPHFAKAETTEAEAGDVLVLAGDGTRENPGHNLVVRSRCELPPDGGGVRERWPGARAFLEARTDGKPDEIHLFQVDSAFGAGPAGDAHGGVRRDVLLFNANKGTWCTCRDTIPPAVATGKVPYDEVRITGFFRPRVTP